MALSFSNCVDHRNECRIIIQGNKVILYDPNGNVTVEHSCNFTPTSAYWAEGPHGGWCIVCENGSFDRGEYFSNVGTGVLPFVSYSQKRKNDELRRKQEEQDAKDEREEFRAQHGNHSSLCNCILNCLAENIPGMRSIINCCC